VNRTCYFTAITTARNPPVLESLMCWRRRRIDSQTTPSLIPSYGSPSHQTHNIDLSQTQISRSYRNSGYHASGQGIINTQTNYNYYRDSSSSKLGVSGSLPYTVYLKINQRNSRNVVLTAPPSTLPHASILLVAQSPLEFGSPNP
jgi:hypothetical protein